MTTASFAAYLALGAVLVFKYDSIQGDALSRVSQAYAVVASRDPKLAAIGFVWTPLPVLLMIPFIPLKVIWPALTERGFLINLESAAAMAASVGVIVATLRDWGVRRAPRLLLALCFAAHPLIWIYGANGMTEALLILCLVAAVRRLSAWLRDGSVGQLAMGGLFLGLGYLTRYEAAGAAAACIAGVAIVTLFRTPGSWRERRSVALADAVIVGFPSALAFTGWALTSWVIVGNPFEQFTSTYGNSAQLKTEIASGTVSAIPHPLTFLAWQIVGLEPLLVLIVLLACAHAWWRRNPRLLAIVAGTGSVIALQVLLFLRGQTADWLRFKILVVPFAVLLVGTILGRRTESDNLVRPMHARHIRPSRFTRPAVASLAVLSLLTPALVTSASIMQRRDIAPDVASALPWKLPVLRGAGATDEIGSSLHAFAEDREVAQYVDSLHVSDGAVLADVAVAFAVVLASKHPKQFLITSDRDFEAAVSDPATFHVQYLLTTPYTGMNALARQYPTLYDNGAGIATLVRTFTPPRHQLGTTWRLYRVKPLT